MAYLICLIINFMLSRTLIANIETQHWSLIVIDGDFTGVINVCYADITDYTFPLQNK